MANISRFLSTVKSALLGTGSKADDAVTYVDGKAVKLEVLPATKTAENTVETAITPIAKYADDTSNVYVAASKAAKTESVLSDAAKITSPLKTAAKVAAAGVAGAGLTYIATSNQAQAQTTPEPVIVENPDTENGGTTYIYNTGNEGVDEALGWLQTQIDEIISFLNDLVNSLFGTGTGEGGGSGSGTGTTPYDIGVYTGETETGGISPIKIIIVLIIAAVVIGFVIKKFGKKGKKGKKGGKK